MGVGVWEGGVSSSSSSSSSSVVVVVVASVAGVVVVVVVVVGFGWLRVFGFWVAGFRDLCCFICMHVVVGHHTKQKGVQ